jgi:hypothetical protein
MLGEKDGKVSWLEAETLDDVKELEQLEKLLLMVECSPLVEVADFGPSSEKQEYKTWRITYQQSGIEKIYDLVRRYR